MKQYLAELHTHTVLSPCAGVEMIPPLIVKRAVENGIDILAITDHNATGNVGAVQKAAHNLPLIVLPGMELQTREEVHALCIFDTIEQAADLQEIVNNSLPDIPNDPSLFGEQFIVDETGDFIVHETRMLAASTTLSLKDACNTVHDLGGLFIPAHINRKAFGLFQVLGLMPDDFEPDALEISRHLQPKDLAKAYPQGKGYPLIQNGDVHFLDDFLGVNQFTLEHPDTQEIKKAFKKQEGRNLTLLGIK